jgi:hypothetical protein
MKTRKRTRKQRKGILKRIKIRETGDQFPKYDNQIFTILIESCSKDSKDPDQIGICKIKWVKVPKKCCKWDIPISYDTMEKRKWFDFWFLGDADYEVIFLD